MKKKIMFDTSAINKLEDCGPTSEPLMRGLQCGYEILLAGTNADEAVATPDPRRRGALLSRLMRLMSSGTWVWPPHEVIRLLAADHWKDPLRFEWTRVDIRARDYEAGVPRHQFDDVLSFEQKKHQYRLEKDFQRMWKQLRPKLDEILSKEPSRRPQSYQEAVAIATMQGGVLWGLGQRLYEFVSRQTPSEAEINSFMSACPPFRSVCYALVMAWHNGALRPNDGQKDRAGRIDLMMAACLPYCDLFLTSDWPQRQNLREVAAAAELNCEILLLSEFESRLALVA